MDPASRPTDEVVDIPSGVPPEKWAQLLAAAEGRPSEPESATEDAPQEPPTDEVEAPAAEQPADPDVIQASEDADDVSLESVPEQYRSLAKKYADKRVAGLQRSVAKTTQEVGEQRKQVETLLKFSQESGLPPEKVAKLAQDYMYLTEKLQSDPEGTLNQLKGVFVKQKVEKPDFSLMTGEEVAAYYEKQTEERLKQMEAKFEQKLVEKTKPIADAANTRALQEQYQVWRASRKDVSDDELKQAISLQQKHRELLDRVRESGGTLDDVNGIVDPYIQIVKAMNSAKANAKPLTKPRTEVPRGAAGEPVIKATSNREIVEQIAKNMGFDDIDALAASMRRKR